LRRRRRSAPARAHAQREVEVVRHRHVAEQRVVLEHQADAAFARRQVRDVALVQCHATVVDRREACEGAQQRALAAAGGPEQHEELAGRDLDRHVVDDRDTLVDLRDLLDADGHGLTSARADTRGCRRHRRLRRGDIAVTCRAQRPA
jgi:hypothetical protein